MKVYWFRSISLQYFFFAADVFTIDVLQSRSSPFQFIVTKWIYQVKNDLIVLLKCLFLLLMLLLLYSIYRVNVVYNLCTRKLYLLKSNTCVIMRYTDLSGIFRPFLKRLAELAMYPNYPSNSRGYARALTVFRGTTRTVIGQIGNHC